jgi:hypothetical protein
MLSAVELENWKCVGGRIRIDLGPLTLLFGVNNAGKSTILQSLLYMLELLERGHADVDRTELGGDYIDLGGFGRLVHRHDLTRTLAVRVEFATPGSLNCFNRNLTAFPFPNLDDELETAWIEARVRWFDAPGGGAPFVSELLVGTPDSPKPVVRLSMDRAPRNGDPVHAAIDLTHPVFRADEDGRHALLGGMPMTQGPGLVEVAVSRTARMSLVPSLHEPLRLVVTDDDAEPAAVEWTTWLLEMLVIGTARQLAHTLRDAIYVGPLRAIPPRGFLSERSARLTRWADGLAAWDALLADRGQLVARTNEWLERLGAGCKVNVQQLFDPRASAEAISAEHGEATVRRLLLDVGSRTSVLPCEAGAGLSQVVPIVVAALEGSRRRLVMLEQPELHVHPALQVGLGDLFIEASRERQLLIETHSEHLILRLLRRIEETTENDLPEGAPAFTPDRLCVLYIETGDDGMRVRKLRVDPTGEFMDRWPNGFFEERAKELF